MNIIPPDDRDDRLGLPSASSMDRYAHCPGSWQAEQGLPDLPTEAVTQTGTNVHAALESGSDDGLDLTEKEIAARLREMELRETQNFLAYYNLTGEATIIREQRFKIRDQGLEIVATARPDYCVVVGDYAAVWNFKTGFRDPTPSELSWQARVEVISLWHEVMSRSGTATIRGGFLSSRLKSQCDTTDYTIADLMRVERELFHVLWKIKQPDAERVPGPHCRYCKAQGDCREAATYSLVASYQSPFISGTTKPDALAVAQAVSRMEPAEMAYVFKRKQIANVVFDAVEARLKSLPADVLNPLGYSVVPGSRLKEITDPATAFQRLGSLLTDAERVQCIKITRGKAAELLAERTAISKKKAEAAILEALGDTVIEKVGEPKLKAL